MRLKAKIVAIHVEITHPNGTKIDADIASFPTDGKTTLKKGDESEIDIELDELKRAVHRN